MRALLLAAEAGVDALVLDLDSRLLGPPDWGRRELEGADLGFYDLQFAVALGRARARARRAGSAAGSARARHDSLGRGRRGRAAALGGRRGRDGAPRAAEAAAAFPELPPHELSSPAKYDFSAVWSPARPATARLWRDVLACVRLGGWDQWCYGRHLHHRASVAAAERARGDGAARRARAVRARRARGAASRACAARARSRGARACRESTSAARCASPPLARSLFLGMKLRPAIPLTPLPDHPQPALQVNLARVALSTRDQNNEDKVGAPR